MGKLRSKLNALADYNGFVSCDAVVKEFTGEGVTEASVKQFLNTIRINGQVSALSLLESIRPSVDAAKKTCIANAALSLGALQSGAVVAPEEFLALAQNLKTDTGLVTLYQDAAAILSLEDLTVVLPMPAPKEEEAPAAAEATAA